MIDDIMNKIAFFRKKWYCPKSLTKTFLILGIGVLGILIFLLVTKGASAATITVDDDGGANFSKIRDAIDAANDGDTIQVYEGTYYENIVVDKSVNLIGNGSANTTIDGGGHTNAVKITADGVNMSGFTVRNGARGIKVESDHNHIFENNCSNNSNYGIFLYYSDSNILSNNTCSLNDQDGISLDHSDSNILKNNTCSFND
ncbi:MAG: right-handed parallel beta-helix repeat-containing protein, partial [Thermoplasmata archaeon]|nr:right-handed parallel beta-helix repeat-containing protein [Thermoplasmata archaeon]